MEILKSIPNYSKNNMIPEFDWVHCADDIEDFMEQLNSDSLNANKHYFRTRGKSVKGR